MRQKKTGLITTILLYGLILLSAIDIQVVLLPYVTRQLFSYLSKCHIHFYLLRPYYLIECVPAKQRESYLEYQ